jgi:hypothetical protein
MPFRRPGFNDTLIDARLAWLNGVAYPSAPGGLWVSLLAGVPSSDGSNVVEETPRVSITYGAPSTPSGHPGHPHTRNIAPSASVSFTPTGTAGPGVHINGTAWALWSASSGGSPLYVGAYAWSLLVGVATTLPASTFTVTATEPT